MTATERVRELLDECGVEWTEGIARPELTQVRVDGKVVKFHPWQPNTLKVSLFNITPEQAIAATMGHGVCHRRPHINLTIGDNFLKQSGWDCSECGCRLDLPVIARYCPNCGRKVVGE